MSLIPNRAIHSKISYHNVTLICPYTQSMYEGQSKSHNIFLMSLQHAKYSFHTQKCFSTTELPHFGSGWHISITLHRSCNTMLVVYAHGKFGKKTLTISQKKGLMYEYTMFFKQDMHGNWPIINVSPWKTTKQGYVWARYICPD